MDLSNAMVLNSRVRRCCDGIGEVTHFAVDCVQANQCGMRLPSAKVTQGIARRRVVMVLQFAVLLCIVMALHS